MKDYHEIEEFYQDNYNEDDRMNRNPIEFLRCKEIISRYLSDAKLTIGDIGGATGVFSYWLAELGHSVHLLDYVAAHIEQAKQNGAKHGLSLASYTCGDARQLPYNNAQFDLLLEMGPLYHLQEKDDRLQCLAEAHRTLRSGGVMICDTISRHANMFTGFFRDVITDPLFEGILDENLATGLNSPGDTPYFTTAYFHTPDEIITELEQAGFADITFIPVEGFTCMLDPQELVKDAHKTELALKYLRKTENIRELWGLSNHCIAIGHKL